MPFGDTTINAVSLPAAWNRYFLISTLGDVFPNTDVLPSKYFPANAVSFLDEFFNTSINIQVYSAKQLELGTLLAVMSGPVSVGMTESLNITYSRFGNTGDIGGQQPFLDTALSPRVGFQLGNIFKHQAYIGLTILGMGESIYGQPTFWYSTAGFSTIEYCTNSRFKVAYLSHGRLSGARFDSVNHKQYVTVSNKSSAPKAGFNPGGKMMVWSSKQRPQTVASGSQPPWLPQIFNVASVNSVWEVEITQTVPTTPPQYFVESGDFFILFSDGAQAKAGCMVVNIDTGNTALYGKTGHLVDKNGTLKVDFYGNLGLHDFSSASYGTLNPWVMEDPALMHEYDLNNNDVVPTTHEQRYRGDASVIGVWVPPLPPPTPTVASGSSGPKIIGLNGSLAFGVVAVGSTSSRTLTISNSGTSTLNVSGITYPAGFSGAFNGAILPNGSHDVTVTFTPTTTDPYNGTVTINSDATSGNNTTTATGGPPISVAYADPAVRDGIWLPVDSGDSARRSEGVSFGGTMQLGVQKLVDAKSISVRLAISKLAANNYQNFEAGCLSDEYLIFNGHFYQIIDHPRSDAVEIQTTPVNGMENILPNLNVASNVVTAGIYQRSFWFINEMYPGGGTIAPVNGLWSGKATAVTTTPPAAASGATPTTAGFTLVEWAASPAVLSRMGAPEIQRYGVNSLDLRSLVSAYPNPPLTSTLSPVVAFSTDKTVASGTYSISHPGWMLRDINTNKNYPISKIIVSVNGSGLSLTAVLSGVDPIGIGNTVSVIFDTPYPRYGGAALESSFLSFAQFSPSLGPDPNNFGSSGKNDQIWSIATNGWYDAGIYHFPEDISAGTRFSLVNFSFGYNPLSSRYTSGGSPAIFVATKPSLSSLTLEQKSNRGARSDGRQTRVGEYWLTGRQHLFYDDPNNKSLMAIRSGDTDWANQIEQNVVCVGYPHSTTSTAGLPADAGIILNPTFNIPPENPASGSPYSIYWLRVNNIFYQSNITGRGGINTPLFRRYNLAQPTASAAGCYLPFEFYPLVSSNAAPVATQINAYMPASTNLSDIAMVKVTSAAMPAAVLAGGQVPATGGIPATQVQYALQSQLIQDTTSKEIVYTDDRKLILCYGATLTAHASPHIAAIPLGYGIPAQPDIPANPSVPATTALMVVSSDDEGLHWGSPRIKRPPLVYPATPSLTEWGVPLVLFRDFSFAGAMFDNYSNRLLMFGYVYEFGSQGNPKSMSLAMYAISMATLKLSTTYPVKPTPSSDPVAYMRIPQITAPTVAGTIRADSQWGDESFVKIIGNSASSASIVTADVIQATSIFPSSNGGTLEIKLTNPNDGTVFGVHSQDRGWSWQVDGVIYDRNGATYPYKYQDLQFSFRGNTLVCKRIPLNPDDAAGKSGKAQVLYDNTAEVVVTNDAVPQKIAVKRAGDGTLNIFYVRINGELGGAMSRHGGESWETMVNW